MKRILRYSSQFNPNGKIHQRLYNIVMFALALFLALLFLVFAYTSTNIHSTNHVCGFSVETNSRRRGEYYAY